MTFGLAASLLAVSLFAAAMIYSAMQDVLTMTVSDRVVIALLIGFPILAPLSGWTLEDIGWSVAVAMMTFFLGVAFFAAGWIGGGDGKLATVTVLWVGADSALDLVAYTTLLGGACAIGLLLFRTLTLSPASQQTGWIARLHAPSTGIPYAVAIGLAALSVLPGTPWMGALGG
ncbi:MAG TPA: prepilin peptidase [Aestuariivirgaceae bacterium]|nr:prepilin peptidase [Aestuariivirgaceae bacterium]